MGSRFSSVDQVGRKHQKRAKFRNQEDSVKMKIVGSENARLLWVGLRQGRVKLICTEYMGNFGGKTRGNRDQLPGLGGRFVSK